MILLNGWRFASGGGAQHSYSRSLAMYSKGGCPYDFISYLRISHEFHHQFKDMLFEYVRNIDLYK